MIPRLAQVRCLNVLVLRRNSMLCGRISPTVLTKVGIGGGSRGYRGQPETLNTNDSAEGQRVAPARLVVTHSSYMDGLIPLLDRFVADPDTAANVTSVIPARIYVVKGRSELFKMTVRDTTNGFKALVRKGSLGQEVFISTTKMELEDVKAALNRAAGFDLEKGGSRRQQRAGRKRR